MATANQIKYRIGQAKKKLAKLNKDLATTKANIKKLEGNIKKAKVPRLSVKACAKKVGHPKRSRRSTGTGTRNYEAK
jgi:hypothetical protein